MNILLLAPHPFYQPRGTPIAVDLLTRSLARRGDHVTLLTYAAGEDRTYDGGTVAIRRAKSLRGFRNNIRPGFSPKKLINDAFMWPEALRWARNGTTVVHAVEEAVFMAMDIRRRHAIPYLFDMDSSMPEQMAEKSFLFRPILPLLRRVEARAIRGALAVVAVCDALADKARAAGAKKVFLLRDVSLLRPLDGPPHDWRAAHPLPSGLLLLYIGNLEPYQGIDLLLEAFAIARHHHPDLALAVAGGTTVHVAQYRARVAALGLSQAVFLAGPQPVERMAALCAGADILVSPRTRGKNTPMKIYSYLDAGKPLLATRLATHTQVLDDEIAMLADPDPASMATAMTQLAQDHALRMRLADNARKRAREWYSPAVFEHAVDTIYDWVSERLAPSD